MIANLPIEERVAFGQADEERQAACLSAQGFRIESASQHDDMVNKIDRYLVRNDGVREKIQIKGRDDSDTSRRIKDILSDVYEPYCGLDHPETIIGRDSLSQYDWFTCRINTQMYLVSGKAHKKIISNVLEEWRSSDEREFVDQHIGRFVRTMGRSNSGSILWQRSDVFSRFYPMKSTLYPKTEDGRSIEVRCTQDRRNNRPKLLVFVPPTIFTEKQARIYDMGSF